MDQLLQDVRFALRGARRAPLVFLAAVLSIAIGIAATTTVFTLVNGLLLRVLPLPGGNALYAIDEDRVGHMEAGPEGMHVPYTRFLAYREGTRAVFSGVAGHSLVNVSLRLGQDARAAEADAVTANYFAVLGVRPVLGGVFTGETEPQAVLSYGVWSGQLGADPRVLGRPIYIEGHAFTVVGVAPRGFGGTFGGSAVDVWVPIRALAQIGRSDWLMPFGRLRPGVSARTAAALVRVVAYRTPPEEPQTRVRGVTLKHLTALPARAAAGVTSFLALLFAAALLVLAIAAANVAGVLLARGVARRQELAIRLATGAARGRLVRQLLTESALLFLCGGALGVALAGDAMSVIGRLHPYFWTTMTLQFPLDARVLAFALGLTLVAALAAGLVPALQGTRAAIVTALGESGPRGTGSGRGRTVFVTAQLAMAVLLLVSATLLLRSLRNGLHDDPGFDPDGVVVASMNTWQRGYDEARGRAFFARVLEQVRAVPGVESAGLSLVPPGYAAMCNDVERAVAGPDTHSRSACYSIVDPAFFRTVRLQLVAGRALDEQDRAGAPPVAVVNEAIASALWPGENAVGQRYRSNGQLYTVVGVVRNVRLGGASDGPFAYYPYAQQYSGLMAVHARVRGETAPVLARIREIVHQLDPDLALQAEEPLTAMIGAGLLAQRLASSIVGAFGLIGLLLAGLGVYGVLAFQVAQRTREIGIRMAVGAGRREIRRLVLRRGLVLAGAGVAIGLAGAAALTWVLSSLLVGISPFDPATFLGVGLLLVGTALLASWVPARRACATDPIAAIRAE